MYPFGTSTLLSVEVQVSFPVVSDFFWLQFLYTFTFLVHLFYREFAESWNLSNFCRSTWMASKPSQEESDFSEYHRRQLRCSSSSSNPLHHRNWTFVEGRMGRADVLLQPQKQRPWGYHPIQAWISLGSNLSNNSPGGQISVAYYRKGWGEIYGDQYICSNTGLNQGTDRFYWSTWGGDQWLSRP